MNEMFSPGQTFTGMPSNWQHKLTQLRSQNPEAWAQANRYLSTHADAESYRLPPRAFHWPNERDARPEFHPFERQLRVFNDTRFILTSLLNVKPLAGESDEWPSGWWVDTSARENFIDYFRRLLQLLGFLQVR